MSNERDTTPIQSRYAQQYSEDLAANRAEQAGIDTKITTLQERLDQLKQDEKWLVQAQTQAEGAARSEVSAPGVEAPAVVEADAEADAETDAETEGASGSEAAPDASASASAEPTEPAAQTPAVPKPRQAKRTKAAASKPPAKKAPAKRATARKTAAKRTAPEAPAAEAPDAPKAKAKTKAEPPLHALVLGVLLKTPGEARAVRDISNALSAEHPQRATSIQVVRNNLEKLAKDNSVTKATEGGAVTYTAKAADGQGGAAEPTPEAVPAEA
ncbi:hypothetical protein [Streptomyces sp. NPDC050504]|uniref:hypothetical protein n=1 Tax=Streptomyces sp. NPDC050504 TaxID=3365618 RepID=UPI0037A57F1B